MQYLSQLAIACLLCLLPLSALAEDRPKRDWSPVELVGHVSNYQYFREYLSYYWAEDFTFLFCEEKTGRTWRIISREPTPAYEWRMGPTYTGLKVNWKDRLRVKVIGVKAVDRIPAKFHGMKLDEPLLATALLVFVETDSGQWKEFYVNNWFHSWGSRADKLIHKYYVEKGAPYYIFGFARSQAAPFDRKSQAIIDRNKTNPSLMFQGRIHASKARTFGYEIELIDLIGRDVASGGATILHGNARTIPLLDRRKGP